MKEYQGFRKEILYESFFKMHKMGGVSFSDGDLFAPPDASGSGFSLLLPVGIRGCVCCDCENSTASRTLGQQYNEQRDGVVERSSCFQFQVLAILLTRMCTLRL